MICNCKSRVKNEPISHFLFALFIPDKEMKGLLYRRAIQMSMFCLIRETGVTPPESPHRGGDVAQLTCWGGRSWGTWVFTGRLSPGAGSRFLSSVLAASLRSAFPRPCITSILASRVAWAQQRGGGGRLEPLEAVLRGGCWRHSFPPSWQGAER